MREPQRIVLVMTQKQLQTTFFFGLLLIVISLTVMILLPYSMTIAMAVTFSVIFYPLFERLLSVIHSRSIAAAVTVSITMLLIALPLALIGTNIVSESSRLYSELGTGKLFTTDFSALTLEKLQMYFPSYAQTIQRFLPHLTVNIQTYAEQLLSWIVSNLGTIFTNTLQTFFQVVLGIVAFFFLLKDGPTLLTSLTALSPLAERHDRAILHMLELAINSVIKGTLLIAICQGVSSGIGLWLFGLPNPTLWGFIAAICAIIPVLGAAVTLLPAVVYLAITGKFLAAAGLFVWMLTAVGLLDNIVGTFVVSRSINIHPMFILLSVLGGISAFGTAGFLLGPLIISLLYAMLEIYRTLFTGKRKATDLSL